MNKYVLTIILLFLMSVLLYSASNKENYDNLGGGVYPASVNNVLLEDVYPINSKSGVSKNSGHDIWWHYPIFEVGSYDQITNNIRFSNNPDTGRCMPADVCGTLYKEYQTQSNYVFPLPPVKPECGSNSRINYYYTNTNMLPYKSETANILY